MPIRLRSGLLAGREDVARVRVIAPLANRGNIASHPCATVWSPNNLRRATVPDRMRAAPEQSAHARRGVLSGNGESLLVLQQCDKLGQLPHMVSESSGHCGGDAEGLVDAAEIVVDKMHGASEAVILQFFRECISQASEPAHLHPHRQVVSLCVGRANLRLIGIAADDFFPRSDQSARRKSSCAVTVNLDEHPVINRLIQPCCLDGHEVGVMAVGGELHTLGEAGREIAHELICALRATISDIPTGDELGLTADCHPRPCVTPTLFFFLGARVALLGPGETPNLVTLQIIAREIDHDFCREFFARVAKFDTQSLHGLFCRASDTTGSADAVALAETSYDARAVSIGESAHKSSQVNFANEHRYNFGTTCEIGDLLPFRRGPKWGPAAQHQNLAIAVYTRVTSILPIIALHCQSAAGYAEANVVFPALDFYEPSHLRHMSIVARPRKHFRFFHRIYYFHIFLSVFGWRHCQPDREDDIS